MKVSLRLSTKTDVRGMNEIMLTAKKKVGQKVITMRANSGVKISAQFFSPEVGVAFDLRHSIPQRVRDWHFDAKRKLDDLLLRIAEEEPTTRHGLAEMSSTWLRDVVEKYYYPEAKKVETQSTQSLGATIYDYGCVYLQENDISYSYRMQIKCVLRSISRYEGYIRETRDRRFKFSPNTVSLATIEDFMRYLKEECEISARFPQMFDKLNNRLPEFLKGSDNLKTIRMRGNNSIHGKMKRLRSLWKWMLDTHRVENNPFAGFRNVAERYGVPYYLTIEERDRIASTPMPTDALETQRDVFIFQCYVGCRVSDLMELSERNITNGILSYVPQKTHREASPTMARVPLHATALALIDKYKGKDEKGRLLPFISSQKYNDAIKAVFRVAGIDRCVPIRNSLSGVDELRPLYEVASSHLARRTFVANLYLKVQDPALIGKMSGHTENSRAFSRYRKIEDEVLADVVNKYL